MDIPSLIIKIIILALGVTCFVLLTMFHKAMFNGYEKLIVCAVFTGFLIIFVAFTVGTVIEEDVDDDLNAAWGLYGFVGYMGAGILCIVVFTDRNDKEAAYGIVGGAVAVVQSIVLALDTWFLQRRIAGMAAYRKN